MSGLKSILLHLDTATTISQRLRCAGTLAQAHGARVEAMYAVMPALLQAPYAFAADGQAAALLLSGEAEQRERARAAFERERAGHPGLTGASWRESDNEPLRAFTQRAWSADLLVLAQHDPASQSYAGVPPDFATSVMLATGKPALVLPYIETGPALGDRVLVAWKPCPEAARAVSAALPLLQRAREVHVTLWQEAAGDVANAPLPIETFLERHGVHATVHRDGKAPRELGDLLLSQAADLQADLLVMGCYGHGRAREWVLGGATRTVLGSMTLPVLMAH